MTARKKILFYSILVLMLFGSLRFLDYLAGRLFLRYNASYYVYEPGYYRVEAKKGSTLIFANSLGIRSPEIRPRENRARVMFLGDSFTFGGGGVHEDDTFVRVSENITRKKYSLDHVNAGIIAYGPANSLGLYRAIQSRVDPTIVLLCLYQNDVNDSGETALYKRMRANRKKRLLDFILFSLAPNISNYYFKRKVTGEFQKNILKFYNPVKKVSRKDLEESKRNARSGRKLNKIKASPEKIRRFLLQVATPYIKRMDVKPAVVQKWARNGSAFIVEHGVNIVDIPHLVYGLVEPDYLVKSIDLTGDGAAYFSNMTSIIRDMRAEVKRNGQKFGLVYIPSEVMYNEAKIARYRGFNFRVNEKWLRGKTRVEAELENFAKKENIPFLNLTPMFRRLPDRDLTYTYDLHFSEKGHARAGELIADFLDKRFLGPKDRKPKDPRIAPSIKTERK